MAPAGNDLAAQQRRADHLATELLTVAGWVGSCPPVVVDRSLPRHQRAHCSIRRGHERIRIHPRVLDEPEAVQRGTMAHEIAHLIEGRATGWPVALTATTVLWAIAIASIVRALRGDPPDVQWRDQVLAIVISLLAWRTAVAPLRSAEYRADTKSVALVGRDAVLTTLRQLQAETPRYFRAVAAAGFETHPSARQRLRHVQRR